MRQHAESSCHVMLVRVPVSVDGTLPSIIGLEKACRAFAGGATCVMVGDPFFFFFLLSHSPLIFSRLSSGLMLI